MLFRYNTLFTYTNENILLITGVILNVFVRPDKHLQIFKFPVKMCLLPSEQ